VTASFMSYALESGIRNRWLCKGAMKVAGGIGQQRRRAGSHHPRAFVGIPSNAVTALLLGAWSFTASSRVRCSSLSSRSVLGIVASMYVGNVLLGCLLNLPAGSGVGEFLRIPIACCSNRAALSIVGVIRPTRTCSTCGVMLGFGVAGYVLLKPQV